MKEEIVYFYNPRFLEKGIQELRVHDERYISYKNKNNNEKYLEGIVSWYSLIEPKEKENFETTFIILPYFTDDYIQDDELFLIFRDDAYHVCSYDKDRLSCVYKEDAKRFIDIRQDIINKTKQHLRELQNFIH